MNNQEIKLFAYQPYGSGQYSFFVMEANEAEAYEYVAQYIKKTFSSTCSHPYAGFGTNNYKLTVLNRGEVIDNAND